MTALYAGLLGIVQGLTEFLPISSSAHLILARAFFGWDSDQFGLAFDVACHAGTVLALVAYFRGELAALLRAARHPLRAAPDEPARRLWLIIAGTIPVVVVGLAFGDAIEEALRTVGVVVSALVIGAVALLAAERLGTRGRAEASLTIPEVFAIGCAQAAALIPGVSRSGATIAAGLLLGLQRDAAARFGFLLGVPAILAATAKEGLELVRHGATTETMALFAIGLASSAVVGFFTVKYLIRYLAGHATDVFAYYRLLLAASVVVWLWWR